MTEVPVNVYGRTDDATAVVYQLLAHFPLATLAVVDDVTVVTLEVPPGAPRPTTLTVNISAAHLAGADGDRQRQGLAGFLRTGGLVGPGLDRALGVVDDVRVAVAILGVDHAALDDETAEAVAELAEALAGWADGFVLSLGEGELRGPDGEVWASVADVAAVAAAPAVEGPVPSDAGEPRGEADIPASLVDAAAAAGDLGAGVVLVDLPDELDTPAAAPEPPPTSRVVARLLVLVAVSARALTEEDGRHLEEARRGIARWRDELGIAGEVEEHERAVLDAEPGTLDRQARVDGSWGAEAAAVLAWSLGLLELPAPDVLVEPRDTYEAIGFPDPEQTIAVLGRARLRPRPELEDRREELAAVRRALRPADAGEPAADGGLLVGGRAPADADPEDLRLATSIALERYRAITWLLVGGRYSDTDLTA